MLARFSLSKVPKISKSSRTVFAFAALFTMNSMLFANPTSKNNRSCLKLAKPINPDNTFVRTPSWPYNKQVAKQKPTKLVPADKFVRTPSWPY